MRSIESAGRFLDDFGRFLLLYVSEGAIHTETYKLQKVQSSHHCLSHILHSVVTRRNLLFASPSTMCAYPSRKASQHGPFGHTLPPLHPSTLSPNKNTPHPKPGILQIHPHVIHVPGTWPLHSLPKLDRAKSSSSASIYQNLVITLQSRSVRSPK